MDINADSHEWSTNFQVRRLDILVLRQEQEFPRIKNQPMNHHYKNSKAQGIRDKTWDADLADMQLIS